jgi:gluconokinase
VASIVELTDEVKKLLALLAHRRQRGNTRPYAVVLMGVAGCGKTTTALQIMQVALALHPGTSLIEYVEGDDLHPASNKSKMGRGVALNDADRRPWLAALRSRIQDDSVPLRLVTCSALKVAYRDFLRGAIDDIGISADETPLRSARCGVSFIHVDVHRDEVERRLETRAGHFAGASLANSQFATLEPLVEGLPQDLTVVVQGGNGVSLVSVTCVKHIIGCLQRDLAMPPRRSTMGSSAERASFSTSCEAATPQAAVERSHKTKTPAALHPTPPPLPISVEADALRLRLRGAVDDLVAPFSAAVAVPSSSLRAYCSTNGTGDTGIGVA